MILKINALGDRTGRGFTEYTHQLKTDVVRWELLGK